jgi:ribosome-binding factor A
LKRRLAEEIDLRVVPKLRFFYDPTPEKADRIDSLLAQIRGEIPIDEDKTEEDEIDE